MKRDEIDDRYDAGNEDSFSTGMDSLFFQEAVKGRVEANEMFVHYFVNDEMEVDFPQIASEFLLHIGPKRNEYADMMFATDSMDVMSPMDAMSVKIMNMIFGAYQDEDPYTVELIRCMYKTYYRSEYKSLKRFHTISYDELCAFENDWEPIEETMVRILTVAPAFGIEPMGDTAMAYIRIHDYYQDIFSGCYPLVPDYFTLPEENFRKNQEEAEKVYPNLESPDPIGERNYKRYSRIERFTAKAFAYYGMVKDYDAECDMGIGGLSRDFAITKTILESAYPKKTFTENEVRLFLRIFRLIKAFSTQLKDFNEDLDIVLGREYDFRFEESKWKPIEEKKGNVSEPAKKEEPLTTKLLSHKEQDSNLSQMELQIEELQKALQSKERKLQQVQTMYQDLRRQMKEMEIDEDKYQEVHEELVNLRNFAYGLTEEDIQVSKVDLTTMEDAIRDKKIIIIGGHNNWTSQLKQKFPAWRFMRPNISVASDPHTVIGADHVYFFTDTICHSTYGIFIHLVREKKIPFGYIHSTNIEKNIRQIYGDVKSAK